MFWQLSEVLVFLPVVCHGCSLSLLILLRKMWLENIIGGQMFVFNTPVMFSASFPLRIQFPMESAMRSFIYYSHVF